MNLSRIWPGASELDALVVSARAGSREALGTLLARSRDYLLLVADRELGGDLAGKLGASDLVQETFVRAQEAFAGFQGECEKELLGWLRQILLHRLMDARREFSHTQKRELDRELSTNSDSSVAAAVALMPAGDESPSARLKAQEAAAALYAAVEALPADYRRVITLRYWKELSFDEIGRRMERSAGAARKLWARALEQLRYAGDIERVGP
jgi:RNA polymerase sigma-70 factor, ECF subfamily